MTADHHCKQEAKISAHGEQIKGICEKLDEFKQDIKADIQRIFQKLDERPSWKITALLSGALGSCITIIAVFIKVLFSK